MRRLFCAISVLAALGAIAGCATQSKVERDFGTSLRLAVANQVLDPEAGENLTPVEGMSGDVAQKVYERFVKQFEKREKEPSYMFTIGSQGGQSK
jgi:hypothetical protein